MAPDTDQQVQELRAIRETVRADCGILWPDPRDGVPMVGTGHCHDTCLEAATKELSMEGGFFLHPDGNHYEHSWLRGDDETIVDPTADQWHLTGLDDVARIGGESKFAERYIVCEPLLTEEGYWESSSYVVPEGLAIPGPPLPPQRGVPDDAFNYADEA